MGFKLGLDLHGVIDTHPVRYIKLANIILKYSYSEVHILSGPPMEQLMKELQEIANKYNQGHMFWTHTFSIVEHIKETGVPYNIDDKGHYWCNKVKWDEAKGLYAKEKGLDLIIDNNSDYYPYCPNGSFLLLKDFKESK
jgi:hypothetical protein